MFLTYLILFLNITFSNKIIFEDDHKHNSHNHLLNDSLSIQDAKLVRTNMNAFIDSPSGKFRVHYDTIGTEAVSTLDEDFNGIPDYIDSTLIFLEISYDVQVNQLAWNAPLSDSSLSNNGGNGAIDVYIMDMSTAKFINTTGTYGVAAPDDLFESNIGNSGVLYIDNNYTDSIYKTRSYEALKVTIAHEFHHVIQFSYVKNHPSQTVFEMMATYMEDKVFEGILDMKNYVNPLLKNPLNYQLSEGSIFVGYMYNIYLHYMDLKYGQQIVEELWVSVLNKQGNYLNIWDSFLQENYNVTIEETFVDFYQWCYYTGEKSIEGKYFPFADKLDGMIPKNVYTYSNPSVSESKQLYPLGFNLFKVIYPYTITGSTNDTIDVLITNVNADNIDYDPSSDTYFFATTKNQMVDSEKLTNIDYYFQTDFKETFDYHIFEYPGLHPDDFAGPSPSPYRMSLHNSLLFPVSENHQAFEKVELQILNSNMQNIHKEEVSIEIINNKKVINFSNSKILNSSGIYFYSIKSADDSKFGKFAVVK